jgi:hypothetical protein
MAQSRLFIRASKSLVILVLMSTFSATIGCAGSLVVLVIGVGSAAAIEALDAVLEEARDEEAPDAAGLAGELRGFEASRYCAHTHTHTHKHMNNETQRDIKDCSVMNGLLAPIATNSSNR